MTNQHRRAITLTLIAAGAVAAGYAAGILSAPKSGKQTRRSIRTTVNRTEKNVRKTAKSTERQAAASLKAAKKEAVDKLAGIRSRVTPRSAATSPAKRRVSGQRVPSAKASPKK